MDWAANARTPTTRFRDRVRLRGPVAVRFLSPSGGNTNCWFCQSDPARAVKPTLRRAGERRPSTLSISPSKCPAARISRARCSFSVQGRRGIFIAFSPTLLFWVTFLRSVRFSIFPLEMALLACARRRPSVYRWQKVLLEIAAPIYRSPISSLPYGRLSLIPRDWI
jgi:hypothetical protein